jgi:hypothetical protein
MKAKTSKSGLPGMRYLLAGAAISLVLAVNAESASADPISLGGYTGPITIKFENYESFTNPAGPVPGSSNFGVFAITSILGGGNILYQAPIGAPSAANPLIVGVFSGIQVTGSSGAPPTETTYNTGGVFSLYDDTSQLFGTGGIAGQGIAGYAAAGCAVNTQCYNGITNKGYDNILNLALVPGADSSTAPATTGTGDGVTSTIVGTVTVASPLTGGASGYADITGGSDASEFGTGGETTGAGTLADVFFQDDFCASATGNCSGPIADWALGSQDPIAAVAVPEPASLALFGMGLLGFGLLFRRKQKRGADLAA